MKEGGSEPKIIDRWMMSRLQHRIAETRAALEALRTRHALQNAFYLLMNDLRWYQRRGGASSLTSVVDVWIRLMTPFTPHVCEELWEIGGGGSRGDRRGFVSLADYPVPDANLIDRVAERAEELVRRTIDDIEEIIRVATIKPEKITLFTAPAWKNIAFERVLLAKQSAQSEKLDMGALMKELMQNPDLKSHARDLPKFVQRSITDVQRWGEDQVADSLEKLDELNVLSESSEFMEAEFGCPVEVIDSDDAGDDVDPQGRRRFAEPGRPAIYIEGGTI